MIRFPTPQKIFTSRDAKQWSWKYDPNPNNAFFSANHSIDFTIELYSSMTPGKTWKSFPRPWKTFQLILLRKVFNKVPSAYLSIFFPHLDFIMANIQKFDTVTRRILEMSWGVKLPSGLRPQGSHWEGLVFPQKGSGFLG